MKIFNADLKVIYMLLLMSVFLLAPNKANAQFMCCNCANLVNSVSNDQWNTSGSGTVDVISNHLDAEFNAQEQWMIAVLLEDNILPAMMLMAEQLTVVAMYQVQIFGSFLDAKHQNETQRLFQKLQAEAHKDYHPSVGMCEFGSATKSLAASERKGEIVSIVLSQRSLDRQLGSPNTSGQYGVNLDKSSRVEQFKSTFCDPWDHNNGLWQMCRSTPSPTGASPPVAPNAAARARLNKDIDYARTVDFPWTLDIDFTDTDLTYQEEEVMALAANLYAHDVFERIDAAALSTPTDDRIGSGITDIQKTYMDMRSLIAKRSVAESSFNAIVGMKSAGTAGSRDYLTALLKNLGVGDPVDPTDLDEINFLLGHKTFDPGSPPADPLVAPSYYAQMEVLTKKIYQSPDFYTNLYDKPANVMRKNASIQAIGLMQKFDMFKSYLRSEASLSVLLELAVMKLQSDIENEINATDSTGDYVP